jgi:hypothetical protein
MARRAIDPLFRSVAVSFGSRAVAVVLTGWLNDGASGLADVKRCGGTTVVQNPADALAPDMPWGALRASDVDYRAPLADMADLLIRLAQDEAGRAVDIPEHIRTEVESPSAGDRIPRSWRNSPIPSRFPARVAAACCPRSNDHRRCASAARLATPIPLTRWTSGSKNDRRGASGCAANCGRTGAADEEDGR